jgi:hypothetical protein
MEEVAGSIPARSTKSFRDIDNYTRRGPATTAGCHGKAQAEGARPMDEKFLRNVDEALGNWLGEDVQEPPRFGGKPGEPVPAVDPEDVKTVWQIGRDVEVNHPGKDVAVGVNVMKQVCKPGADIEAVSYRAGFAWLISQIAPEHLARFTREGQLDDAVFRAAAKVPAEWMGVGIVRQGPPFDLNEFLRLCGEETEKG